MPNKQNNLNLDPNKNLIYVKNNFRPEKIKQKNILDFLIHSENSLQKMLDQQNGDVMIALQNLRTAALIDEKIPRVNEKLYAELLDTITLDKKRPLSTIYDERLKRLTYTQEKIYKVLYKIEEDLIDEQDTTIKHNDKESNSKIDEEYIKKLINQEIKNRTNGTGGELGVLGALLGLIPFGKLPKFKPKAPPVPDKSNSTPRKNPIRNGKLSKFMDKLSKLKSWKKIVKKILLKAASVAVNPVVWIIYELIAVFYKIAKYWAEAPRCIDYKYSNKVFEEFVFAVAAGTSEWVREQAEILEFVSELILFVCKEINDFKECVSELVENQTVKSIIMSVLNFILLVPFDVIGWAVEKLNSLIKLFLEKGVFGFDAGFNALEVFWDITDDMPIWVKKFILGGNEALNKATKHGLLVGGVFKTSRIAGNVVDIARNYTTNELKELAKHKELGTDNLARIQAALNSKREGAFRDEEVLINRKQDQRLQKIINSLEINNTAFGVEWYEFAQLCNGQIRLHPGECILEGHVMNNKIESITIPNVLAYDNKEQSIIEVRDFFNALIPAIKNSGINTSDIDKWKNNIGYFMYFTVYGTIILSYKIRGITQFEKLKKEYKVLFPKINPDGSATINKVIGCFDPGTMKIKPLTVEMSDKVFKEVFKNNIILHPEQNYYRIAIDSTHPLSSEDFKNPLKNYSSGSSSVVPKIINMPHIEQSPSAKVTKDAVTKRVWDYLTTEMGFTKEQAAGIMGNMMQESSMNPKAKNSKGGGEGAHGLCQWRGPRLKALKALASSMGKDIYDLDVQLEFLKQELLGTHKNAYNAIKKSKSVEEATVAWVDKFEIPGAHERHVDKRTSYAYSYLNPSTVPTPTISSDNNSSTSEQSGNLAVKAAKIATENAFSRSNHVCALHVREALQKAGIPVPKLGHAYTWRGKLEKYGFGVVHEGLNGFKPQAGDLVVINRLQSKDPKKLGYYGHVAIYNGKNWVSDFVQKGPSVYGVGAPNGAWYYRYKNGNTSTNQSANMEPNVSDIPNADVSPSSTSKQSQSVYTQKTQQNNNKETVVTIPEIPIQENNKEYHYGDAEGLFSIKYVFGKILIDD